ncbi:type II toxin-antitoxin system HicA family toxin [Acidithiobacillus sp.]|uniref:type II toxin-antitoxin system HicA family toxin n=1 Tax=Acidithiobacillus sp. TaxID=1872118 RepID=UPI00341359DC
MEHRATMRRPRLKFLRSGPLLIPRTKGKCPPPQLPSSQWPSLKARLVLAALIRIGWRVKRQSGSHRTLSRPDCPDVVLAFHDEACQADRAIPGGLSITFTILSVNSGQPADCEPSKIRTPAQQGSVATRRNDVLRFV